MLDTPAGPKVAIDSSRSALEFVHRLLGSSSGDRADLAELLSELAAAFAASVAGLATLPDGVPMGVHPTPIGQSPAEIPLPWRDDVALVDRLLHARAALTAPLPGGGSCLLTALGSQERGGWILWIEDANRSEWTESEAAVLPLVGQALTRWLTSDKAPRWAEQLDRGLRQQRLEMTANVVRRLAHDFGNVLTGILGFSELALTQQVGPNTPLHSYLTEVYRGAQNGAQYTNELRLFARRQSNTSRSCTLSTVLAEEEKRLRPELGNGIQLKLELPADLPAVALDAEQLRQVLAVLLDNAHEAMSGPGVITVSARTVRLSESECRDLFGCVRAGAHLEIAVADAGCGLTPEAWQHLFAEPFFTTKPRKRGFGLAIAYGILAAHRGGLELVRRPEGGVLARAVVPLAVVAAPVAIPIASRPAVSAEASPHSDRVLVVDDDPMILQFVTKTLERAGYRVRAVANAEDAVRIYTDSTVEPFCLVLSDVLMPDVSGIDLAKRLLAHDANVRVLFMSGHVPAEFTQQEFAPGQFELLSKPFRPEGLVRAVRASLDRVLPRRQMIAAR